MVRHTTAREKRMADRQICANVFVNKGEGGVKGKTSCSLLEATL
jgi:hypothetical protein